MKSTFKKLIAVILAAVMVAGVVPMLAIAETASKVINDATAEKPLVGGYIHTDMHGARGLQSVRARRYGNLLRPYRRFSRHAAQLL